jgi:hypothetical protein
MRSSKRVNPGAFFRLEEWQYRWFVQLIFQNWFFERAFRQNSNIKVVSNERMRFVI